MTIMPSVKPSEILRREFGVWLQKERESRGISQKFVADRAGFTVTQLSRIENGRSGTRRETVILMAEIIGIDVTKALRKFAPESSAHMPEELEGIPFYEFDKQDLLEIADFINFKLLQKRKTENHHQPLSQKAEIERKNTAVPTNVAEPELNFPAPEDLTEVPTYYFEKGRLVSDSKLGAHGHTSKKPSDKRF